MYEHNFGSRIVHHIQCRNLVYRSSSMFCSGVEIDEFIVLCLNIRTLQKTDNRNELPQQRKQIHKRKTKTKRTKDRCSKITNTFKIYLRRGQKRPVRWPKHESHRARDQAFRHTVEPVHTESHQGLSYGPSKSEYRS